MSEPLQQTEDRQLDISPEAANAWEERLKKRGLSGGEEQEQTEGEGQQQETTGAPARPSPSRREEQPQNRMLPPAVGHRERQERRQALAAQGARLDKLEESLQSLVKLLNPELPPDPEADPRAYTTDLVKKAAIAALEEHPLLKEIHEERQTLRQQQEEIQRENEYLQGWGDEMTGWEADYIRGNAELDLAYKQRLNAFLQVSYQMHFQLGDPPQIAERKAVRGLMALTDRALEAGVNPAAYVDYLFQQTPAVQQTVQQQGRQQQRRENRESRERREAGAAASTLSTTKAPPAPERPMKVALEDAPQGRGRAGTLAKLARQKGNAKAALRELRGS